MHSERQRDKDRKRETDTERQLEYNNFRSKCRKNSNRQVVNYCLLFCIKKKGKKKKKKKRIGAYNNDIFSFFLLNPSTL